MVDDDTSGVVKLRFLIMRKVPAFIDDDGTEIELDSRAGQLLRILLLSRGDDRGGGRPLTARGLPLTKQTIAWHMPAQKASKATHVGQPVKPNTIEGYKGQLEGVIGEGWIETIKDSYRFDVDPAEVDAFACQRKIDELGVNGMSDVEDADPSDIKALRELKASWQANPAEEFSRTDLESLALIYTEYQRSYERLRYALVYALLQRGEHGNLGEAKSLLTAIARSTSPSTEPEIWSLLLRTCGSLPTYREDVPWVLRMVESQEGTIPKDIETLSKHVLAREADLLYGTAGLPAGHDQSSLPGGVADSPDVDALQAIAREVGISGDGSSLRLQDGTTKPVACIEATNRRLYFSGVFAGKWVDSGYVRSRFELLLNRLDHEDGDVRFLILDPESESFARYSDLTKSGESPESIPYLKQYANAHRSFQVRMFDALPTFRIIVLDEDVVSVSPYLLGTYNHISGHQGWDAAHVALSPFAPWSLARSFESLFLEQWRSARPIGELA